MNYSEIVQTLEGEVKRHEAQAQFLQVEELKRGHLTIAENLRAAAQIVKKMEK